MTRAFASSFCILADVFPVPRGREISLGEMPAADIIAWVLIAVGIGATTAALIILRKKKK